MMKKIAILVAFLLTLNSAKCQKEIFDKDWIAINSEQLKRAKWISPMDGIILNFQEQEVFMSYIFSDSILSYPYKIKGKEIYLEDTLFCKIKSLDNYEMELDFDKKMRVKFQSNEDVKNVNEIPDFTKTSDWFLFAHDLILELRLTNEIWEGFKNSSARIAVIQYGNEIYKKTDWEMWNVFPVEKPKYFVITHGQMEKWTFLIERFENDTLYMKEFIHSVYGDFKLVKQKEILEKKKQTIQNQISSNWKSSKIIDFSSGMEKDSIIQNHISGIMGNDTAFFQRKSLINNELTIKFNHDFSYEIIESGIKKLEGIWRISETGRHIILDSGWTSERYIDIIENDYNKLIIGKMNRFQIDGEKGFAEYYYKIELTK